MSPQSRHLSRSAVEEYLRTTAPASIVVPGEPTCRIVIDPGTRRMSLRTPLARSDRSPLPSVDAFEHIEVRSISAEGRAWSELVVDHGDRVHESYLLLSDITDMIQQNGLSFAAAVRNALAMFEDLLSRAGRLGIEEQVGLYGELLFLEACVRRGGPSEAMAAWKGADAAEHDFVFGVGAFEVKTTRTERRRHRISSLEQLQPTPEADLWLVSMQLTTGSSGARTLADLVDDVRTAVGSSRPALDAALATVGWRDRDRTRYPERWTLRTAPAAYLVGPDFPVLGRIHVDQACPRPDLITEASYTIDITSLSKGAPPAPADRFVQGDG
jgi:hypothetical protein